MAQYLNPYEGVGNALINIGQNYDLDRRRKRESEEDQKRRRADYLWQSKQEEERANREYERDAPKRDLEMKRLALQHAKAQADLVTAQIKAASPNIINLPGAGGAIELSPQFDAEGNVSGVSRKNIPFTPYPRQPREPNYERVYDPETGNLKLFNPETRETIDTGARGTAPPLMNQLSPKELNKLRGDEARDLAAIDTMVPEKLGIDPNTPFDQMPAAIEAAKSRMRKQVAEQYRMRRGETEAPAAASTSPSMLGTIGAAAKGFGGLMAGVAEAVTPMTEPDIIADYESGKIDSVEMANRLSRVSGTPVKVDMTNPSTGKQEKAESKPKDITKTPEFKAKVQELKKQYKDATDAEIKEYLLETWGK